MKLCGVDLPHVGRHHERAPVAVEVEEGDVGHERRTRRSFAPISGLRERAVGVAPVGCSVLAYNYFNCDMFEASHGRAPAVATGAKRLHSMENPSRAMRGPLTARSAHIRNHPACRRCPGAAGRSSAQARISGPMAIATVAARPRATAAIARIVFIVCPSLR